MKEYALKASQIREVLIKRELNYEEKAINDESKGNKC